MNIIDIVLYGGVAVGVVVGTFFVYRFFRKNRKETPQHQVMNKIQEFYSVQDSIGNK